MTLSLLLLSALALPCNGVCDSLKHHESVDVMLYKEEGGKKLLLATEETQAHQFPGGFSFLRCPDANADAEDKTIGTCRKGYTCCPRTPLRLSPEKCEQKMEGNNCKLDDICAMKEQDAKKEALGQMLDLATVADEKVFLSMEQQGRIMHNFKSPKTGELGENDMLVYTLDVSAGMTILDEVNLPASEKKAKPKWFECDKKMMDEAHRIKNGKKGDFEWMEKHGNFYHADLFMIGDVAKKFNCPAPKGGVGKVILVIILILIVVIGVGALVYIQTQRKPLMPPTSTSLLEQGRSIELAAK